MTDETKPLRIMIAVPSYKGFNANDLTLSLMKLVTMRTDPGIEWLPSFSRACPVLPRVRNSMAAEAIARGCTHLLFVDDDIGFKPEDVIRMIGHDVGIVAAVPQKRNSKWSDPPKMAIAPDGLRLDTNSGLAIPPDPKAPMALTLIKTEVFRKIGEAQFEGRPVAPRFLYPLSSKEAQQHMRMYFGYELAPCPEWSAEYALGKELGWADDEIMSEDGEDHFFCRRAAFVGETVYLDTEVELLHMEGNVAHDYSLKKLMASDQVVLRKQDEAA